MKDIIEFFRQNLVGISLGVLGGSIHEMQNEQITFKGYILGFLMIIFVSIVTSLLIENMKLHWTIDAAIIAISGYCSRFTIDILQKTYKKKIKEILDKK